MAAPFVTDAAMVRKAGDGLPYKRTRKLLLSNVDKSKAFKQTTVTGGRLNAARAMTDV